MRTLRHAVSVGGLMLLTGNVAAASSGHYDSGHFAVMAVVGGAVALGSSALGGYLGAAGLDAKKVATTAADYAAKLVKEASPKGGAIDAAYTVAKGAAGDADAAAGMAEGLTDVATGQLKEAVKTGAAEGLASSGPLTQPAAAGPVGATARFCRECGTPAREAARFCASCGRKLG